jgi:hypothetical protein
MNHYCKYCNKQLKSFITSAHYRCCDQYKKHNDDLSKKLTKEFLEEEYLIKMKSLRQIGIENKIENKRLLSTLIEKYQIPTRSAKERATNLTRQQATKVKCIEKYGIDHHLKLQSIIDKRTSTVQQKYGVENIFQDQSIKDKIKLQNLEKYGVEFNIQRPDIKRQITDTNMRKYGVDNPWKNKEIIEKMKDKKFLNNSISYTYSKVSQKLFWNIYNKLPESLKNHVYFAELNKEFGKRTETGYYYYDFCIPSIKYCIEYHGTYYHADPSVYDKTWINKRLNKSAEEIWSRDLLKHTTLKELGFDINIVWQREEYDIALKRCLDEINEKIRLNT